MENGMWRNVVMLTRGPIGSVVSPAAKHVFDVLPMGRHEKNNETKSEMCRKCQQNVRIPCTLAREGNREIAEKKSNLGSARSKTYFPKISRRKAAARRTLY